jgi:hypothetical protein
MPARVNVPQRIIKTIGVPVVTLRIGRVGDNGIRADKPPQPCIIVPGIVEVKPRLVQPLAGELDIGLIWFLCY